MSHKWRKSKKERPAVPNSIGEPPGTPTQSNPPAGQPAAPTAPEKPTAGPPAPETPATEIPAGPATPPTDGANPLVRGPLQLPPRIQVIVDAASAHLNTIIVVCTVMTSLAGVVGGIWFGVSWYINHVIDQKIIPLNNDRIASDALRSMQLQSCRGDFANIISTIDGLKKQIGKGFDDLMPDLKSEISAWTLFAYCSQDDFHLIDLEEVKKLRSHLVRNMCSKTNFYVGLCQLVTKQYDDARTSFRAAIVSPTLASECACGNYSVSHIAGWYAFADLMNPANRTVDEKLEAAWQNLGAMVEIRSVYTPHVQYSLTLIAKDQLAGFVMADKGAVKTALSQPIDRLSHKGFIVENGKLLELARNDNRLVLKGPAPQFKDASARNLEAFMLADIISGNVHPGPAPMDITEPPPLANPNEPTKLPGPPK